jgi:ABC-type branched-subunit amino acid transport system ATPase component
LDKKAPSGKRCLEGDRGMLGVNNIEIVYNDVIRVIRGISFQVPLKGMIALLGSNGAGKTTVLKAVSNVLDLEQGEITEGTVTFNYLGISLAKKVYWLDKTTIEYW